MHDISAKEHLMNV